MNRRTVLAATVAAIVSVTATAAETAREREEVQPVQRLDVRALFERAPGVITENEDGLTLSGFAVEVVIARIGEDGKLVKACVDTEEAARLFFEKPVVGKEARQK